SLHSKGENHAKENCYCRSRLPDPVPVGRCFCASPIHRPWSVMAQHTGRFGQPELPRLCLCIGRCPLHSSERFLREHFGQRRYRQRSIHHVADRTFRAARFDSATAGTGLECNTCNCPAVVYNDGATTVTATPMSDGTLQLNTTGSTTQCDPVDCNIKRQ